MVELIIFTPKVAKMARFEGLIIIIFLTMITIEVHNFYSKQAEDVRVYNDLPEKEREALDKMVLANGKEKDFTICTLPMPISEKCLITDLIRPFVRKDGYIRGDAWNVVHNINGYEVRFINKAIFPE